MFPRVAGKPNCSLCTLDHENTTFMCFLCTLDPTHIIYIFCLVFAVHFTFLPSTFFLFLYRRPGCLLIFLSTTCGAAVIARVVDSMSNCVSTGG